MTTSVIFMLVIEFEAEQEGKKRNVGLRFQKSNSLY